MVHERKPFTILMADDDEEDRMMTREALSEAKVFNDFRYVEDGERLLDYLYGRGEFAQAEQAPRPTLILLDLKMPRLGGQEALARIKADPQLRRIPIIVLSSSRAENDVHAAYDMGVNSYIAKPTSFSGLVELMRTIGEYWLGTVELPINGNTYGRRALQGTPR